MRKYLFGCVCAGLLACTAFATEGRVIPVTDYHHTLHHPYSGYYYHPHPYIYDSFDHDHHYPYEYNWSQHRHYSPYYSEEEQETDTPRRYYEKDL